MLITKTSTFKTPESFWDSLKSLGFLTNSREGKKDCILIQNPITTLSQADLQQVLDRTIAHFNMPLFCAVALTPDPSKINPVTRQPYPPSIGFFQKNVWSKDKGVSFMMGGSNS